MTSPKTHPVPSKDDCPVKGKDGDGAKKRFVGTVTIRMSNKLRDHLERRAMDDDRSLSYIIIKDICKAEGIDFDEYK